MLFIVISGYDIWPFHKLSACIFILLSTGPCTFKRRELATSLETRTRFPELVIQEEKRVRFVVVNGLDIVEKPSNMHIDDAEW
jgi:hypothetical protein